MWHGHPPQFWGGIAAAAVLVLLLILAVWWYLAHRQGCAVDGDCPPGSVCIDGRCFRRGKATLADKWKFMGLASVDQKCNGVDRSGTLIEGGRPTKAPNFGAVKVEDFKCRGAAGLPGGPPLQGGDWPGFCAAVGKAGARVISGKHPPDSVVLVEGETVIAAPPLSAGGLVVRRGGTCYLLPTAAGAAFEFGFVLVESGGVLQAGSTAGGRTGKYRISPKTPMVLRLAGGPAGWWREGVPASQYPAEVHNPGMSTSDQCYGSPPAAAVEVACLNNATGPRSFGVCFNGTAHFAGWTPAEAPFHLWRALEASGGKPLTSGSRLAADKYGDQAQEGVPAALRYRPWDSYPATFVEIVAVAADRRSIRTKAPVDWAPGSQVAVSSPSPSWDFAACGSHTKPGCFGNGLCGPREFGFYVHGEGRGPPANSSGGGGVDVAKVATVRASGDGSQVAFTEPLVYPHRAGRSAFTAANGGKVEVETYGHAGLLSRSIRIEGVPEGALSQKGLPPTYFTPTGEGGGHPMGKMNATSVAAALTATSCGPPPDEGQWAGPGGGVQCDLATNYSSPPTGTVYRAAGTSFGGPPTPLYGWYRQQLKPIPGCGAPPPPPNARSGWYGQDPQKCGPGGAGLDCILGGTVKVMYGASFRFDGVELYRLGLPGNAGSLGEYSVHFHLAGWGRAFRLYTVAPRELALENCSNWRTFSRWVAIHGTNLASIRNNVFVLSAGNGILFEDGTEILNDLEHNLCLLAMPTSRFKELYADFGGDPLGGVIGAAGFDNQMVSSIWLTNPANHVARNVFACNPGNGLAIWTLGEAAANKQGPASLITGDPRRRLPGLVGDALVSLTPPTRRPLWRAGDDVLVGASTFFVQAASGQWVVRLNWKSPGDATNQFQAYRLLAENSCYGCLGFELENPAERSPYLTGVMNEAAISGIHDLASFYMPTNADSSGGQMSHAFAGNYPAPGTVTRSGDWVYSPRVLCQNLIFDMGGAVYAAWAGVAWAQDGGIVSIGDAILGADFLSNSSQAAMVGNNYWQMGPFNAILCGSVLAGPIPGATTHSGAPHGTLLFGDCLVSISGSCVGTAQASRPAAFGGDTVGCNAISDGQPPSFLAVAGYTRGNPLGADKGAVASTLAYFSRSAAALSGMDPDDQYSAAGSGPRVVLYDYPGRLKWEAPEGGGWPSSQAQSSAFAPTTRASSAGKPAGCETPEVAAASLPLALSAPGKALWAWLCGNAPLLPAYPK